MKKLMLIPLVLLAVAMCGCSSPEDSDKYGDMSVSGSREGGNLVLKNMNSWAWKDVKITLNDSYTYTLSSFPANSQRTIALSSFTDGKGYRFNYLLQDCKKINIWCYDPKGKFKSWYGNWN